MIKIGTLLSIRDNSGAIQIGCIGLSKLYQTDGAHNGCIIKGSVKKNIFKKNIIKKSRIIIKSQIVTALVITTKYKFNRIGHFSFSTNINSAVLLNQYYLPFATRITIFIFRELRQKIKFRKIISLALFLL